MKKFGFLLFLFSHVLWANISKTDECIKLTAHVKFKIPDTVVLYEDVDWRKSIPVCEKAYTESPDDFKVIYGLGRSYDRKWEETHLKSANKLKFEYIKMSYYAGFKHAAWVLSATYIENKDWEKADYWLEQGMENGDMNAFNQKAELLFDSSYDLPKNYAKAIKILQSVEENNNSDVFNNLGKLYYYTNYGQQNNAKAKAYFEKAAQQEHDQSLYRLGEIYQLGIGVNKNDKVSADYYFRAKQAGNTFTNLNKNLVKVAWNVWLQNKNIKYYDIAINTMRELAIEKDRESLGTLDDMQVSYQPEVTPLDSPIVNAQANIYIKRANQAIKNNERNPTDANAKKVKKTIKDLAELMFRHGTYKPLNDFFDEYYDENYKPLLGLKEYYHTIIMAKNYVDYSNSHDLVYATMYASRSKNPELLALVDDILSFKKNSDSEKTAIQPKTKAKIQSEVNNFINRIDSLLEMEAYQLAEKEAVKSQIDINAQRSEDGMSLLHLAIWYNDYELVQDLVKKEADINLTDKKGDTPLTYAIRDNNTPIINYLKSLGAKN